MLGAMVSYGGIFITNHLEKLETSRKERAEHIEKLMRAASDLRIANLDIIASSLSSASHIRADGTADFHFLTEAMEPLKEIEIISELYLPEARIEAQTVFKDYSDCLTASKKPITAIFQNIPHGQPVLLKFDQTVFDKLDKDIHVLDDKLKSLINCD